MLDDNQCTLNKSTGHRLILPVMGAVGIEVFLESFGDTLARSLFLCVVEGSGLGLATGNFFSHLETPI